MSVILLETNKSGKYEFTKDELQKLLDKVEQEAFERGLAFEQKLREQKYVYINGPSIDKTYPLNPCGNWNEVTCTDANQKCCCATTSDQPNAHIY